MSLFAAEGAHLYRRTIPVSKEPQPLMASQAIKSLYVPNSINVAWCSSTQELRKFGARLKRPETPIEKTNNTVSTRCRKSGKLAAIDLVTPNGRVKDKRSLGANRLFFERDGSCYWLKWQTPVT